MTKFCVFCGGPPAHKTREHILPRWLLKLTGNPTRQAYFGRDWLSPGLDKRIYSWEQFTFPACESCNERWSQLEADVQRIVMGMLDGALVSAGDLTLLLDWFDKVRIGLWLGMLYLNKNYRGVIPQFHINDRVGQKDRALLLFESQEKEEGIGLSGCDTPVFHTSPSACVIRINALHFVTVSFDFLLAERFGWPFARERTFLNADTDGFMADLTHGTEKIAAPLFDTMPGPSGTVFLQPIAPQDMRKRAPQAFVEYYSNAHVKGLSSEPDKGVGLVFFDNSNPTPYPSIPSDTWKPREAHPAGLLQHVLGLWVAILQKRLYLDLPDHSHFPEKERQARDREIRGIVSIQDLIINHIRDGGG